VSGSKDNTIKNWRMVARDRPKRDPLMDFGGAIRGEHDIKRESMSFRKRVVSNK
jgi:hypothetical protein